MHKSIPSCSYPVQCNANTVLMQYDNNFGFVWKFHNVINSKEMYLENFNGSIHVVIVITTLSPVYGFNLI